MKDFFEARDRAEDMLMDPLICHTRLVEARVIREIENPQMDKRRYAIAFLGNERISEALPVLDKIVYDGQEEDYIRGDALESIYLIEPEKGLEIANEFQGRMGTLGRFSKDLLDGTYQEYRRTYWQALMGIHK